LPGPLQFVPGNEPWFVRVKFISNLPRKSLPWPVITRDFLGWDYRPSKENEWLLLSAAAPRPATEDEEHAAEKGGETLARKTREVVKSAARGAESGSKIVVIVLGLALGLAALSYIRRATA
jgi:hypothetical protein